MTLPANWTDGGSPFHASDENAVEAKVNSHDGAIMLFPVTIYSSNTSPVIGQTSYYNATGGNRTPTLPALSGLTAGQRLAVRRDPADTSTNTVTLSCAGADVFYSSGATSATFPLSGEQREFQVISVSGIKYWTPAGSINPISSLDGRYPLKTGGSLDGCTIGATTPAVSITTNTVGTAQTLTLAGTQLPWLNQNGTVTGTLSGGGALNRLVMVDKIAGSTSGTQYVVGLSVLDSVLTPAVGPRLAIQGTVAVTSAGNNIDSQDKLAQYVGVLGRSTTGASLGGTSSLAIGQFWGGWFQALTTGGTYHHSMFGIEIDVSAAAAQVQLKIGLRIQTTIADTTRGSVDDTAISVVVANPSAVTWRNGILFGTEQANTYSPNPAGTSGLWPFGSDSTIIGTSSAGNGLPANIGIDFSNVTFSGPAIKLPAAPIAMAEMASAPTAITGDGQLYVASDGSLHYLSPGGTNTQLAPA